MGAKQHTIELNGKIYDAKTGKLLRTNGGSIGHAQARELPVSNKSNAAARHKSKPGNAHAVHHKTVRSKTLMRHAVKKPAGKPVKSSSVVKHPPQKAGDINPRHLKRALEINRSSLVSKFGTNSTAVKATTSVLPVQPQPELVPESQEKYTPPDFSRSPNRVSSRLNFEKAIHEATSHTQPRHKKPGKRDRISNKFHVSSRIVSFTGVSVAAIVLAGIIAWQSVPDMSMRLASARAGIESRLPGYQPAGFGLSGPIEYKPGQVVLSYKSHTDNRSYTVSQEATDWSNQDLIFKFFMEKHIDYLEIKDGAKTVYIYDSHNATWIDNGVWYRIEGNSSLGSDQLFKLAASL